MELAVFVGEEGVQNDFQQPERPRISLQERTISTADCYLILSRQKAAQTGNVEVVRMWINWLEHHPDQKHQLLNQADENGMTAAHYAAQSNYTEIMEVLIESSGAECDFCVRNKESLTPLHLACLNGNVHIVDLIVRKVSDDNKAAVLSAEDMHRQTPLHYAAKSNCVDVISLLLKKDANMEAFNDAQQTPLLLAIVSGQVQAALTLIESGASLEVVDLDHKNPLHLATEKENMILLKAFSSGQCVERISDAQDCNGETPLHIAAKRGFLSAVKFFIQIGVTPNIKDKKNMFPIHVAAEKGYAHVVQELLSCQDSAVKDCERSSPTPLHLACRRGHEDVVEVFIKAGIDLDSTNCEMHQTPLHAAASGGSYPVVKLLLDARVKIDSMDTNGKTPLVLAIEKKANISIVAALVEKGAKVMYGRQHMVNCLLLAADEGNSEAATVLVHSSQWNTVLSSSVMQKLVTRLPNVAEEALNRCMKKEKQRPSVFQSPQLNQSSQLNQDEEAGFLDSDHTQKKDEFFTFNYEFIQETVRISPSENEEHANPLSAMVKHGRLILLKHPVVSSLIKLKWKKYGRFVYLWNLSFYTVFLIFLTAYALLVLDPLHPTCVKVLSGTFNGTGPDDCEGLSVQNYQFVYGASVIVLLLTCIRIFLELFQFMRLRHAYFKHWINWMELTLYFCTLNFVWVYSNSCLCPHERQWEFGTVSVFLGWIILTVFVDKLPGTGIYVVMFVSIFKTFVKTIVLLILLITSFGLAFYMLFHLPDITRTPFGTPARALIKTMTMSAGEFDFDTTFRQEPGDLGLPDIAYPSMSFLLWVVFLVLVPVLLTNLLTGLAVGDVKEIQEEAELRRISLKVDFILSIEAFRDQFQKYLPKKLYDLLCTNNTESFWMYHDLSVWQKLQLWGQKYISGEEFIAVVERSQERKYAQKQCQDKAEVREVIRSLGKGTLQDHKQEAMKKAINELQMSVSKLSRKNEEIQKLVSCLREENNELKQAVLELCNHSRHQERLILKLAQKHGIESDPVTQE